MRKTQKHNENNWSNVERAKIGQAFADAPQGGTTQTVQGIEQPHNERLLAVDNVEGDKGGQNHPRDNGVGVKLKQYADEIDKGIKHLAAMVG